MVSCRNKLGIIGRSVSTRRTMALLLMKSREGPGYFASPFPLCLLFHFSSFYFLSLLVGHFLQPYTKFSMAVYKRWPSVTGGKKKKKKMQAAIAWQCACTCDFMLNAKRAYAIINQLQLVKLKTHFPPSCK